jgi:hypothetical protein
MRERDLKMSCVVTIYYPWELGLGLDDSPIWDEPLSRIKVKDLPKLRLNVVAVIGPKPADSISSN